MSARQCDRVLSAIARQPWAITPDGLELILGIAQRSAKDPQAVLSTPAVRRDSGNVLMRDGVAVISIMGPIFSRADIFTEICGATCVETIALRFGEALAAADVKGIVLHIDSPGGQITGVHELAGQVFAARGIKPVVAYASGLCASAAYWIASAAQRIVADETAYLGSIGVVSTWTDDKEARQSKGLRDYEVVSSQSPNKRLDPASVEGLAAWQRLLDSTADIFIGDVARNRNKRPETVTDQFGQGGVMLAAEAVKVGMADEIGSLEGVIADLSHMDGTASSMGTPMAHINKETSMNKEELAKAHPELLAQIRSEAAAEVEASAAAALAQSQANMLGMVRVVAGEDAAKRMEPLLAAGLTADQVAAITGAFGDLAAPAGKSGGDDQSNGAQAAQEEQSGREKILAGILAKTPGPVNTATTVTDADPVQAAITRISKLGV